MFPNSPGKKHDLLDHNATAPVAPEVFKAFGVVLIPQE